MDNDKLAFRGHIQRHQRSWKTNHYLWHENNKTIIIRQPLVCTNFQYRTFGGSASDGQAQNQSNKDEKEQIHGERLARHRLSGRILHPGHYVRFNSHNVKV